VSGADDPHVDSLLGRGADLADPLFLDHPQQLDLHGQRQVGHLVEEQGAAVGRLEEAVPVAVGAGERALAVAEELALHQVFRDGAAIDGHERSGRPGAQLVDQARRQFLAAARFAGDVDRGLAARDALDHTAHRGHRRRIADQFRTAGALDFLADRQVDRRLDQRPQLVERDRLRQVIEGPRLEGLYRILHAAVRGDDGNRQLGIALGDQTDQRQAIAVGQAHVGQAEAVGPG